MRIAYISVDDATDVSSWSGIPFHLLSSLRDRGMEVSLISPLKRNINNVLLAHKALAGFRGRRIDVDRFPIVLDSYARQVERRIRSRHLDLVFSTSSIPITRLRCSQPIVIYSDAVFHCISNYYPEFSMCTKSAMQRGREQEEAALANVTFAVYASEWASNSAKDITESSKIRVVPFGANLQINRTAAEMERTIEKRCARIRHGCTLLFAGVHWQRKGGEIAVNTARILNERGIPTKLLIVGCDPPSPVPEFVERFGFISKRTEEGKRQFCELYDRADLFLLPTRAEASAIVFCEAAAFGLPILTTDTGGVGTYVHDGQNGYKISLRDDGTDFAEVAKRILQSSVTYSSLSRAAFNAFTTRLNWGASADSLIDIFKEALERKPRLQNARLSIAASLSN